MKTIFLNGLMPERHGHFVRRLAARHTIAGTRLPDLEGVPDLNLLPFETGEDISAEIAAADIPRRLEEETRRLVDCLQEDLTHSPQGRDGGIRLDPQYVQQTLRGKVAQVLLMDLKFRLFARQYPVDLVISGSDYAVQARPIALCARRLGIPTLNLEHGFFFSRTAPDFVRRRGWLPPFFASEFVNVENAMEAELLSRELEVFGLPAPRFLTLGTPIESVADQSLARSEALAALGLDASRTQVLLIGSWIEARSVQRLLAGQLESMRIYHDLFAELARREYRHRMQLVIKLHPAEARPDVFPGIQAGLTRMATDCGLPAPLILADRLPEAMAAADLLITTGLSSVQYDAFLMGKPSITVFPPSIIRCVPREWFTGGTRPLEFGVCEGVTSAAEAWDRAEAFQEETRRARFQADSRAFADRYGLGNTPLDDKCDAILDWIEGLPASGTGCASPGS